jgi:hypothetical protein
MADPEVKFIDEAGTETVTKGRLACRPPDMSSYPSGKGPFAEPGAGDHAKIQKRLAVQQVFVMPAPDAEFVRLEKPRIYSSFIRNTPFPLVNVRSCYEVFYVQQFPENRIFSFFIDHGTPPEQAASPDHRNP